MLIGKVILMIGIQLADICIFLGGNLITWSSKKQQVVARSSTEAEYRALFSAATELVWIQNLLTEIGLQLQSQPPLLWSNNIGAHALACNPVYHARTKHIDLDVHFIRNLITDNKLEVMYVPTATQPAYIFTKALSLDWFSLLRNKLTMTYHMLSLREPVVVHAPDKNTSVANYFSSAIQSA